MRILSLLLLVAALLPGATVPRMSFEQIVRDSPRAVHGVVVRSWSAWDAQRTAIWTHYEVRVSETLRGPASSTLTISEPGGVAGDVAMRVPGAPRLEVGEQAVLFAYPTPLGHWRIRGWGQGRFPVETVAGRSVVRGPRVDAVRLTDRTAALTAESAGTPGGEDLAAFLGRVRRLVAEEAAR
ncbi:MAG: hypothetical protein H6509_07760 [Bryobacterales bacterium]|nr:hypothetical protein [Acidobacteriota bacterium]MCB9384494.1 hypothetical protein [Bryobacterales bacterium]